MAAKSKIGRTVQAQATPHALAPNAGYFDLETFLPYRLAVVAHTVSRAFSNVYAERFDLTIAEWRLLANLGASEGLTAGDIAIRSSLDKPKVTRALQSLKARGLIVRIAGKADRRQAHIRLSAAGERLFQQIVPDATAWAASLMQGLTAQQANSLADCLVALEHRASVLAAEKN
jgi:DNA-binding MarR family transcriptional regulator